MKFYDKVEIVLKGMLCLCLISCLAILKMESFDSFNTGH